MIAIAICAEQKDDHSNIYKVNLQAFGREAKARLVDAIRRSPNFIPEDRGTGTSASSAHSN